MSRGRMLVVVAMVAAALLGAPVDGAQDEAPYAISARTSRHRTRS